MSIIIKIYQSKMINEVLAASCFHEVKNNIDNTFFGLKKQNVADDEVLAFLDDTLKELRSLKESKLFYDQYANVITAKVYLKELQLQMFNVIN